MVALSFVDFSSFVFFVLLYVVVLLNILFPGIYLAQRDIGAYKKGLYFLLSMGFLPLVIFIHMYFGVTLENKPYVVRSSGFNEISNINYNSEFIKYSGRLEINGTAAFRVSDYVIRNLRRSVLPVLLFVNEAEDKTLILDGNQKFYRNPLFGYFKKSSCVDYVTSRLIDNNRLPVSGMGVYYKEEKDILFYLQSQFKCNTPNKVIIDVPNLYDAAFNPFRYSTEYYELLKRNLTGDGIYVQVFDLSNARKDFFYWSLRHLGANFIKQVAFLFTDILVVLCSDSPEALEITKNNIDKVKKIIEEKEEAKGLFYNEYQLLSHFYLTDINGFIFYLDRERISPIYFLRPVDGNIMSKSLSDNYVSTNARSVELVNWNRDWQLKNILEQNLRAADRSLSALKQAEIECAAGEYEREIERLFKLRRESEWTVDIRNYLSYMLMLKENIIILARWNWKKPGNGKTRRNCITPYWY